MVVVHWQVQSVAPHDVLCVAAFVIHDCAHSGMEEKHCEETRAAQAAVKMIKVLIVFQAGAA